MTLQTILFILSLTFYQSFSWEALPQIPSGRRSQFLVLNEDGGYKYGYDTGNGLAAKQSADSANQVSGHYFYKNKVGQDIDLKYTAGVQGFVPENLEKLLHIPGVPVAPESPAVQPVPVISSYSASQDSSDDQATTGDASYNFHIDTDSYKRHESADPRGNIQGSYSYSNAAGVHDLSYLAGENTGFVATSGSLSRANGLKEGQQAQTYNAVIPSHPQSYSGPVASAVNEINTDGSYAFSYVAGDSTRQESADSGNNVQGKYSYQDDAGSHDLSYVAGSQTGFLVTGGSLSKPNGVSGPQSPVSSYAASSVVKSIPGPVSPVSAVQPSADGSYSFEYSAGDHSRQETADASGNVHGSYSFKNKEGSHDLTYVAGSSTGFLPTGGSLSLPNSLATSVPSHPAIIPYNSVPSQPSSYSSSSEDDQANPGGASYSFNIDTDDYQRHESSDASGNVQGGYSYKNAAGTHDLSYVAGSKTGFLPTGGSLSNPESLVKLAGPSVPVLSRTGVSDDSNDDQANTGDSSYSFTIDTDEYKRKESSDAGGNVQGSFSYKNVAGNHDLSYIAGSSTGFVATSGSLADPNAISSKIGSLPYTKQALPASSNTVESSFVPLVGNEEQNSGDASYSFSVDTDEYKRHETSDASGNIKGSYSYKNSVGNHDLNFVAGSATGFLPTGGSLNIIPGLSEAQLRSGQSFMKSSSHVLNSPVAQSYSVKAASPIFNNNVPSSKISYSLDNNVVVHSYLPPSNEKRKFGYILDTV